MIRILDEQRENFHIKSFFQHHMQELLFGQLLELLGLYDQ